MNGFWAVWVMFLMVLNLGIALFLFLWGMRVRIPTLPDGTTGHAWAHGVLREAVRRLPLWWVLLSASMFLVAFTYLALYPGFGSFQGLLGWSSQGELQRDAAANNAKLAAVIDPWRTLEIEQLASNTAAVAIGHRLYLDNCAACHGGKALGNQSVGAPDLTDDDWLYGGSGEAILTSILDGRNGVMPPWGAALDDAGVNDVAAYVLSLSGAKASEGQAAAGKKHFDTFCIACHGADGHGNPAMGAPNLADGAWLYGGDFASVAASIRNGRSGRMPAWRARLSADDARLISAWVLAQGSHVAATGTSR